MAASTSGVPQYPEEVRRYLLSNKFMRKTIQGLPNHEDTQIVAGLDENEDRIVTNGRWCPFAEGKHLPPLGPTAWFAFDSCAMCLHPRCAAPECSNEEVNEEDRVPLIPTDAEVEYCRRKAVFEQTHFKVCFCVE